MPSYTAKELERETGVDRRTIAYYVQEGLLPKVGRRGRRTRYPKLFRDRLLFIRRVREAEEEGDVSAVSLRDIRKVFERVPPALIAGVADGRIAVTPELVSEPSTAFRTPGVRRAVLRDRWVGEERAMSPMQSPPRPAARLYPSGAPAEDEHPDDMLAEPREADVVAREGPQSYVQREVDAPPVYSRMPERSYGPPPAYDDDSELADILADALVDLHEAARRRATEMPESRNTWTRIEISPDIVLSVRGAGGEDDYLVEQVRMAMLELLARRRG